jgi:dihydrofolate synthase / folylpolyglutamate synthase
MITTPIKTRVFQENENLFAFITQYIKKIPEKSVLVVTSKIVALAEGRTAEFKNKKNKICLIKEESTLAIRTKYVWLTIKDGMVVPSAGIDESNANGKLILLPKDSFKAARELRKRLRTHYRIKNLGLIITDSRTLPLRMGVTGVALGYAGFRGIKDYRGTPDIFGRRFHFSRTNIPDGLAAAAVFVMGEGAEQQPLALIKDAPITFCETIRRNELLINPKDDLYRPLFMRLPKQR